MVGISKEFTPESYSLELLVAQFLYNILKYYQTNEKFLKISAYSSFCIDLIM